jgi:hypothetical protein
MAPGTDTKATNYNITIHNVTDAPYVTKEREKIEEVILYIQRKSVFAFCISWALPYLFNTVTNPLSVSSICIRHLKV